MISNKEPKFNDLGNSQPIQIVKDAKTRRFIIRKACSGEKTRVLSGKGELRLISDGL